MLRFPWSQSLLHLDSLALLKATLQRRRLGDVLVPRARGVLAVPRHATTSHPALDVLYNSKHKRTARLQFMRGEQVHLS